VPSVFEIYKWLNNNTGTVGFACFALIAVWQIAKVNRKAKKAEQKLQTTIEKQAGEPLTLHPEIDPALCAGCSSCTTACPEGDILQMIDHRAVLVAPTKCVGHGECEAACPTGAINLVFGTKTRGLDIPRITSNYETNVPGLYIAGELGGMGLIRNAVKQGKLAAQHALAHLTSEKADVDLLVVGAGPAGLAATLSAIAAKKSYVCIEQNSFGGTVYNFPRQKVVMSHPAELPVVGQMKFSKNKVSKEELLEYWNKVRQRAGIKINENTSFQGITMAGKVFEVTTSKGVVRARKVILCMGVRGSPRKLGLPNEDLPKVAYNLIDPEQYQNQDVAVVGGGNAGVEAAQYLGKAQYRNRVTLLVRGKDFDRCNDENKKLIDSMAKQGLVKVSFESSVKEIHPGHLVILAGGQAKPLKNDYLFVFAGAEMPHKFLMSLGIQIDKKFGEKLKKPG
jgi:thioredoxin reductase/Pyruvate/2-oxoacid:ferredoxin oxidoreductase delta subunit